MATFFEATLCASQPSSNNKMPELLINMQLLCLPRKTCSPYSSLDSRLLQQFVKEDTSEKDQLQGGSALQDTEQKTHKSIPAGLILFENQANTASTENRQRSQFHVKNMSYMSGGQK